THTQVYYARQANTQRALKLRLHTSLSLLPCSR
ncbi:unnamed protein product, partial [Fusarium langsethiae]